MRYINQQHKKRVQKDFNYNMKCLIITVMLCFRFAFSSYGQSDSTENGRIKVNSTNDADSNKNVKNGTDTTVTNFIPAAYPGGQMGWLRHISGHLVFPQESRKS